MPRTSLLTALPLALLCSGCGVLSAQLEAQTACATLADYQMPGAYGSGAIDTDVTYDLGQHLSILTEPNTHYQLKLQSVQLALGSASGVTDLGGLDQVAVGIVSPAGAALPEPSLVSYERGADLHPTQITVASPSGLDLQPYVQGGVITLRTHAQGTLPSQPWHATVQACFTVKVTLDYGKQL